MKQLYLFDTEEHNVNRCKYQKHLVKHKNKALKKPSASCQVNTSHFSFSLTGTKMTNN